MGAATQEAGDDSAIPGTHEVRGDDLLDTGGSNKDDKDHVNAGEEENERSGKEDESTIVEECGKEGGGQSLRGRPGEENLDVLASMASYKLKQCEDGNSSVDEEDSGEKEKAARDTQVGKGGARHHLLRHTLDPNKTGENIVKFFDGAISVEEALQITSVMSQKELQSTFSKVYGVSSSSNNNNWLRKKLMEALVPNMWREAWDRYMDEPFSNRGKKDRIRKEREAQEMREKNAKIANYGAFNDFGPVAAQQPATAGFGMDGGYYPMVPPNHAHLGMQYPNQLHRPSNYGGYQEPENELVQALNTMSNLLVQYMNGHRYPPSQPGGYAPYQQHFNPYTNSIYANSGHYGAGMYGQNQMYNTVPYSGIPTGHTPSMPAGFRNSAGQLDGLKNVASDNNGRNSIDKEQIIAMLKQLINNRTEEQQAAKMNEVNQKHMEAGPDDQKGFQVATKDKDLVDSAEHNVFRNLVQKLRDTSSNGSPSKEKSQQSSQAGGNPEAQMQFVGSPLHNAHTMGGAGQVKENANELGPLPSSTLTADKMMLELLQHLLKDR